MDAVDEGFRSRLEARRGRLVVGIIIASLLTWLGGPVLALLLGTVLIQLVFPFGFELSRPVAKGAMADQAWALAVYGLSFLFVPGILAVAYLTGPGADTDLSWLGPTPLEEIGAVMYGASALGALVAAWHIHRRRGDVNQFRLLKKALILVPIGVVVGTFGRDVGLYVGAAAVVGPLATYLGLAFWRVLRPAAVAQGPAEPSPDGPTYKRFHRG